MAKLETNYYAIIPAEVRYDNRLSSSQKLLYAEITALSNQSGYCWASNKYFSDLYDVSKNTISTWMSGLCKYGYVRVDVNRSKGNLRKVYLKNKIPITKNRNTYNEKSLHNNKKNNKSNIKYNKTITYIHNKWNEVFENSTVPKVMSIKGARLNSLISRIKENSEHSFWDDYIQKINESDFLSGRSDEWSATFDWVIQPKNMMKVLEGNYSNTQNQSDWLNKLKKYG
tara:strand:+ start:2066 stop:2746 length:681 start_codon:yes stop_codon:yes gene_type:complete